MILLMVDKKTRSPNSDVNDQIWNHPMKIALMLSSKLRIILELNLSKRNHPVSRPCQQDQHQDQY
jgi:hypothetical protein